MGIQLDLQELLKRKIDLFGSFAKRTEHKNSDIDLLVEFTKGRGLFDDYYSLLHFLENVFDKKVDLVKPSLIREDLKDSILGGIKVEAQI